MWVTRKNKLLFQDMGNGKLGKLFLVPVMKTCHKEPQCFPQKMVCVGRKNKQERGAGEGTRGFVA